MEGPTSSRGLRKRITLLTLQEHDEDDDDDLKWQGIVAGIYFIMAVIFVGSSDSIALVTHVRDTRYLKLAYVGGKNKPAYRTAHCSSACKSVLVNHSGHLIYNRIILVNAVMVCIKDN